MKMTKKRHCPMNPPKDSPRRSSCEGCVWAMDDGQNCLLRALHRRVSVRDTPYYIRKGGENKQW